MFSELSFWMGLGGWWIPLLVLMWILFQSSNTTIILDSRSFLCTIAVYLVVLMSVSDWEGDKLSYVEGFSRLKAGLKIWYEDKDPLFSLLAYIVGCASAWSPLAWFIIVAAGYVGGLIFFIKTIAPKVVPVFLSFVISLGFFSYGVNTLRAGFSLSLLMLSIAFYIRRNVVVAVIFAVSSLGCHFSMLIPLCAFVLGFYIRRPRIFLLGWCLCLALSLVTGESLQAIFGRYFEDASDARLSEYTLNESNHYRVGFRWDFVLYSFLGVGSAFLYKQFYKVKDILYDTILCAYLAANGFWLLLIRIPFSDRLAYLSWFLLPLLLMLPPLRWREVSKKGLKVMLTLSAQLVFWIFMLFYRSGQGI